MTRPVHHMDGTREALDRIEKRLKRIEAKLNRSARFEEHWKALQVMTQPVMGVGFFALALGVPMMVAGYQSDTWPERLSHWIGGILILLMGSSCLSVPIHLQSYFVEKPGRIAGFFRGLRKDEGNPFTFMRKWAVDQGDAGRGVLMAMRRAERVVRFGWWAVALATAALLMLYLAVAALVIEKQWGATAVMVYLGACVAFSVAAAFFNRRSRKARTPRVPQADAKAT